MRVLLTGSTGQLGRALAATAPPDATITAPARSELDLEDPASIARAVAAARPDLVINAAAYTAVDRAEAEPERAFAINARAVEHLGKLAPALVQISTDFVFDGEAGRARAPSDPPRPLGVYGASKRAGETAALAYTSAFVVRTAWLYDAYGSNFVATMLRLMREREEVRVVADQIGTPTHAPGLARAIWALIARRGTAGPIFHWTDAGAASWYDFAVAIQEEALTIGLLARAVPIVPIRTVDYPTPAARPPMSVLDKTDTWAVTGPARHWRTELRDCLKAMR